MLRRTPAPAALVALSPALAGCAMFAECLSHHEFLAREAVLYCEWAVDMGCDGGTGTYEDCIDHVLGSNDAEPTGWEYAESQCGLVWDECRGGRCFWVLEQFYSACDREPWRAQFEKECGDWDQGEDVKCGISVP